MVNKREIQASADSRGGVAFGPPLEGLSVQRQITPISMSEADADKLMKQANKLAAPSLLAMRMRGEWEQATPLYEKAASIYRQAKQHGKAKEAFEKAATGNDRQGSPYHAAKNLEKAGEAAAALAAWDQVRDYYTRAAAAFGEANRAQVAAETLMKCAKVLEAQDAKGATDLYMQAIEILEDEGRGSTALDAFRQAIGSMIRNQRFPDAVNLLLRYAAASEASNAKSSQCRAYLGAVVVQLYAENAAEAWQVYQDALGVDSFSSSEHAYAAEDLFNAYQNADADAVKKCISSKSAFLDLDNQVARLAKQLPKGDVSSMAAALGVHNFTLNTDDVDEDDLT